MPFPNTKASIKYSIYMLVFLTHTTILNETQVPKVSDSTMIVELGPSYFFRFGWKSMCKQTVAKTLTLSLILPFCLIEKITFTLQELLSHLNPLLLDGVVTISLQLHGPQRADFQFMFCNLPKENHPKSLRCDFRAQRCALFSLQSNTACTPSINMLTLTIPMPRSSLSLLT